MAKRRANGEGSIRKRKDGRWEGRYTAGRDSVTGKVIYKNVLGKNQAEVKAKLKSAIEKSGSLVTTTEHFTVGQLLEAWMESYAKLQVRPSSHKTYQCFIENHIKPVLGDVPLEKLTAMDLQRLYKHLLESGRVECTESRSKPEGLSVKSVRNINQMISSALNCAVKQRQSHQGLCPAEAGAEGNENPATGEFEDFPLRYTPALTAPNSRMGHGLGQLQNENSLMRTSSGPSAQPPDANQRTINSCPWSR